MPLRITPVWITNLEPKEVIVFGSNLIGRHNGSAAQIALKFGAESGKGYGLSGQSFAIPTKDEKLKTLRLVDIDVYVEGFLITARARRDLTFLVTEIGCGFSNYDPWDIAPMFEPAVTMKNVYLPNKFLKVLLSKK